MSKTRIFLFVSGLAIVGLSFTTPTNAADFPVVEPTTFSWTGCYIGANAGGGWGDSKWIDPVIGQFSSDNPTGWLAGGQIGCNYQFGAFVLGAEGELDWADLNDSQHHVTGDPDEWTDTTQIDWIGTVAARAGLAFDRALLYGKVGAAWVGAGFDDNGFNPSGPYHYKDNDTRNGIVFGAGLEYALSDHWSIKGEYERIDLNSDNVTLNAVVAKPGQPTELFKSKLDINVFKIGVNFRF